jgi:hypothetical protein
MFKKKWTVVRVLATEQGDEKAVYFPTDKWFWFRRNAMNFAMACGELTYRRGFANVLVDFINGTGWKTVTRQSLETMKNYKEAENE